MKLDTKTRKILVIVGIVLAALVVLSAVRDFAVQQTVIAIGTNLTGAKVDLGGFSMSLLRQTVTITGFKMHHPEGFEKGLLIDVPRVSLDLDAPALIKGKLHIQSASMHLQEMTLIRNKEGKLNVDSLKIAQKKPQETAAQPAQEAKKPQKKMPMQIDELTLQLGRVVMKDYTRGPQPKITVYDLNLKKTYKNITSAEQLAALIMTEPMKSAGVTGAAIYGAAAVAGIGLLPAAAVVTLAGKDSAQKEFVSRADRVYAESLNLVKSTGQLKQEDKAAGVIKATIQGTDMAITIEKQERKTRVTVSARKYLIPKPKEASGFLYHLAERLHEK